MSTKEEELTEAIKELLKFDDMLCDLLEGYEGVEEFFVALRKLRESVQ